MGNLLVVENLTVKYKDKIIIDDFSFDIANNSLNALLCPNNGGKTTLIKTLIGMINKDCGKIILDDIILSKKTFKKYIFKFGVVLENSGCEFICDNVFNELSFPLNNLGCKSSFIKSRVEEVSKELSIDNILNKSIVDLSKVDKIKVLISTSIMHSPKLLLLDDIFRALNDKEQKEIFLILKKIIKKFNISILFTTSDLETVIDLKNIIVMGNGKLITNGDFDNIILKDNELSKSGLSIPIMIDLSRKLQFYELVDSIYYDVDKVVDKLWK